MSATADHRNVHIGITAPRELRDKIAAAAQRAGLPTSTFCRIALAAIVDDDTDQLDQREAA